MSNALILDSLRRRMRAMHSLYEDATATMTLEQVNHVERDSVLLIAFSLFHFVNMEDTTYPVVSGGDGPVWNDDRAARLQLTIPDHGKERTPAEMVGQRIGDYDAFAVETEEMFNLVLDRIQSESEKLFPMVREVTGERELLVA